METVIRKGIREMVVDTSLTPENFEQYFDEFDLFPTRYRDFPRVDFFEDLTLNKKRFKTHASPGY